MSTRASRMNSDAEPEVEELPPAPALDRIARLAALQMLQGKTQKEQVALLQRAGFPHSEMAAIVGITSHQVSVIKTGLKGDKASKKPGAPGKAAPPKAGSSGKKGS